MTANRAPTPRPLDRYGFLHAPEGRRLRGRRIVKALEEFGGVDVAASRILDIGCSAGLIADEIAASAATVIGVDVDIDSLVHARRRGGRARFAAAAAEHLPFADATFDAAVCNHVYEHVRDPGRLMVEVHRVLRPGGACYFAAGHTLQLIEPHYRLPLLSWLPRTAASAWLRASGRGQRYEERFAAPWKLRGLLRPFERIDFISPAMLRAPGRFGLTGLARLPLLLRNAIALASGAVARLAPTWIYMLRKRDADAE